jgi:predicted permease
LTTFRFEAGAVAAYNNVINEVTRKSFSTANLCIFYPSLVLSIAGYYDYNDIVRYLPLMVISLIHAVVGALLSYGAGVCFKLKAPEMHFVVLMNAFNNKYETISQLG